MIRVLVADNSAIDRALLVGLLASDAQMQIVGEAKSGAEAVVMTKRLRPQVVIMGLLNHASDLVLLARERARFDAFVPRPLDGLEATRQIMAETPTPIVIAFHGHESDAQKDTAEQLLAAGAVAALKRPSHAHDAKELIDTVRAMAEVKVVGHRLRRVAKAARPLRVAGPIGVVAIAASTGGPNALVRVLKPLPRDLPVPIVIVQHLATGFMHGFADWLDDHCALDVKLVERSERLLPGTAYLANDGAHLRVHKSAAPARGDSFAPSGTGRFDAPLEPGALPLQPHFSLQLADGAPQEGFCPSASVLFESVAESFGARSLAVILTGMGRDGVSGLGKVRAQGGRVIAQDRDSSVVFGMPSMAIEAGLADDILPVDRIADRILELVRPKEQR
jgi:two-component system, chemotaxis family, protein-glutamate methylesterase/glutaminase